MRLRSLSAASRLLLVRFLLWVLPARQHAVVTGFPDDEGNSVEMVRALSRVMPVYWLTSDHPDAVQWLTPSPEGRCRIRRVRKNTVPAYLAYLTARYVFFTHGLYGSPPPPRHKTFVNLWHGDGPKRSKRFATIRSSFAVAGTELWGRQRPVYFGVDPEGVLVTGNPRVDQLAHPPSAAALRRLGLDPDRRLVLWMPTYRRTEFRGSRLGAVRNWEDADELSRSASVGDLVQGVSEVAEALRVTVAVKPHPLDADRYAALGLPVVTSEELARAGCTLYQLLGSTHGLITDYSSVWTDYLVMDRPVGFYCPDLEEYETSRGLNVKHYADLIPGPLLRGVGDFEAFLHDCVDESPESVQCRRRSQQLVGAETRLGASDRLVEALGIRPRGSKEVSRHDRPHA